MHAAKSKCIHPNRPLSQACADCPRRGRMQLSMDDIVMVSVQSKKKSKCVHPDRPPSKVRCRRLSRAAVLA